MRIIRRSAYSRIGLLGNPSDGYHGKTIATVVKNFSAEVVLYEWPELEIILSRQDRCEFENIEELVEDVRLNGLYGGLRLIKAAIKVFAEYCRRRGYDLSSRNFALRYSTNIPRQVGLAGSSAIITAVWRALMEFYKIEVPNPELANLILSVETEEVGIAAGLQDRVCQVYEGLVYMDFDKDLFARDGWGFYEKLDSGLLPPLYLAFRRNLSKISGVYHSNLRQRWEEGVPEVVQAMKEFADIAKAGRDCLLKRDYVTLAKLMDANFDLRSKLVKLDPTNVEMVRLARSLGVCAKYAGSGGAIVGICEDEDQFERLLQPFSELGCEVVRPEV